MHPGSAQLTVRPIDAAEHLAILRGRGSASFLQTPAWGQVKREWEAESLGWFRDGREPVGCALVLHRRLPGIGRSLAYLPQGPVLDWEAAIEDLPAWLDPLVDHLRSRGAFGIRIGPPVVVRRWDAATVKQGIADDEVGRLGQLPPSTHHDTGAALASALRSLGWRHQDAEGGFAAGQPQFNFVLPLAGRSEEDVLRGMNQLWRRNIRKAARAGVEVEVAADPIAALPQFHRLYVHTARRDGFTPRPLSYFETMFSALGPSRQARDGAGPGTGQVSEIRLYLARHEGDLVAATIWIRVGDHVWYSYGASSTDKREVRGSNAVQWQMIRDAMAAGAAVYDLRGITDTLDGSDPHVGLVQFKVGTGGAATEHVGEWDLPVNRLLYAAFALYLRRR